MAIIGRERNHPFLLTRCGGVSVNNIFQEQMNVQSGKEKVEGRGVEGMAPGPLSETHFGSTLLCLLAGRKRRKRLRCSQCFYSALILTGEGDDDDAAPGEALQANDDPKDFPRYININEFSVPASSVGLRCAQEPSKAERPTAMASFPSCVVVPSEVDCTMNHIKIFLNFSSKGFSKSSPKGPREYSKDSSGKWRSPPEGCARGGGGGGWGGVGRSQFGIVVTVLALMVSLCQALPTQSTHQQTNPYIAYSSRYPPRRDWSLCCGGGGPRVNTVQAGNVTVIRMSPTSVFVTWSRHTLPAKRFKYEVTYKPTNAKYRVVAEVMGPRQSLVLERLLPMTQYQLQVTTFINDTLLRSSPVVTFHTTRDDSFSGNGTGIISTSTVLDADVSLGVFNGSSGSVPPDGLVRVRAEEVGIVLLVLAVWMFAIALFFNRWGKIRMLEPYQEPYKEAPPQLLQHRPSCPMADPCSLPINPLKFENNGSQRPRQNSVFVGRTRSLSLDLHPPRRAKSALNLTTLVLQESEEEAGIATTFT